MKKLFLIILLSTIAAFPQITSKFEKRFLAQTGNPLLGSIINLVPQDGNYPADTLRLTEHQTRKGWYYRDGVPVGEYKIYINGSLYTQNIFHGENVLALIAARFNSTIKLQSTGIGDSALYISHLSPELIAYIQSAGGSGGVGGDSNYVTSTGFDNLYGFYQYYNGITLALSSGYIQLSNYNSTTAKARGLYADTNYVYFGRDGVVGVIDTLISWAQVRSQLSAKQNLITNIGDTSKYQEISDSNSTTNKGWYSRPYLEAKLNALLDSIDAIRTLTGYNPPAGAATFDYYVDAVNGDDANNGTSEATAWKTITKLTSVSFVNGDTIGFRADQEHRGVVTITAADSGIVFTSWGTGSYPVIKGSNKITGWNSGAPYQEIQAGTTSNSRLLRNSASATDYSFGQAIIPSADISVTAFNIWGRARTTNIVGNVWIDILADSTDYPSFTIVGTSDIKDASSIPTGSDAYISFTFSTPVALTNATRYHFYLRGDYPTSTTDFISWAYTSGDVYGADSTVRITRIQVGGQKTEQAADDFKFRLDAYTSGGIANVWNAPITFFDSTSSPGRSSVWFVSDTIRWGTQVTYPSDLNSQYQFAVSNGYLYTYSASGDPNVLYTAIEASVQDFGIDNQLANNVKVQNLAFEFQRRCGVKNNADRCTIQNNRFRYIGDIRQTESSPVGEQGDGAWIYRDNNLLKNNLAYEIGHSIVSVLTSASFTGTQNNIIEGNTVFNCYHNLVDIKSTDAETFVDSTIIRYNVLYNTPDFTRIGVNGIYARAPDGGFSALYYNKRLYVYSNLIYSTTANGINFSLWSDSCFAWNNTIFNTGTLTSASSGIRSENDTARVYIYNNIIMNTRNYCLRFFNATNKTSNNNLLYNVVTGATTIGALGGTGGVPTSTTPYASLALWQGQGFDSFSLNSDPLFTDVNLFDFRLLTGSPADGLGTNLGIVNDLAGNPYEATP